MSLSLMGPYRLRPVWAVLIIPCVRKSIGSTAVWKYCPLYIWGLGWTGIGIILTFLKYLCVLMITFFCVTTILWSLALDVVHNFISSTPVFNTPHIKSSCKHLLCIIESLTLPISINYLRSLLTWNLSTPISTIVKVQHGGMNLLFCLHQNS